MIRTPLLLVATAAVAILFWKVQGRPPAGAVAPATAEAPGAVEVEVLDRAELLYPEDERGPGPRRALAHVGAVLERRGGRARLVLALSASAPGVDPVPGFEGVAGHNRVTARELDRLARERSLGIATRGEAVAERQGTWRVTRRGRVPERRLGPGGRIEHRAAGPEELVLEIAADSGWLAAGTWRTEVLAGGRARLAATFEIHGEGGNSAGRILALEPLSEHPAPGGGP